MSQKSARIGVLLPQGNTVHQRQFEHRCSQSVDFKFLRFSQVSRP
jgi:hypothetical protein